jgi:hypothetical protein
MPRKGADNRARFIKEMDELAFTLAGATKRLPSTMFTEKVEAFKVLTGYANTINRAPAQEEGNAIDQFRKELGVGTAGGDAGGRGSAGPADDDDDPDPDFDDDAESDDDAEYADGDTADTDGTALPPAGVSGPRDGAGGPVDGATFAALRHSVGLPRDK